MGLYFGDSDITDKKYNPMWTLNFLWITATLSEELRSKKGKPEKQTRVEKHVADWLTPYETNSRMRHPSKR